MGFLHFFSIMAIAMVSLTGTTLAAPVPEKSPGALREEARTLLQNHGASAQKAAHAYVHLLKTVDDEKSGEDMIQLIQACQQSGKKLLPEEVLNPTLMPDIPDEAQPESKEPPTGPPYPEEVITKPFIDLNALIGTYMPIHKDNPHFIMAVANYYCNRAPHFMSIRGGISFRTLDRQGHNIPCDVADRKKALSLYRDLLNKHLNDAELKKDKAVLTKIMQGFIAILLKNNSLTWDSYARLLLKTDITPNSPPGEKTTFKSIENIPTDDQGRIVFFSIPKSLETANSDIERVFFLYEQALSHAPENQRLELRLERAKLIASLFSIHNLMRNVDRDDSILATALRESPTLADNQTIIYSQGKPHIITLPPHLDYLGELKTIAKLPADNQTKYDICVELACALISRNQLTEALDYINQADQYADDKYKKKRLAETRDQILKPSVMVIPSSESWIPPVNGNPLSFDIFYRNAHSVKISLTRIDVEAIARDYPQKNARKGILIERSTLADILINANKPDYDRSQYAAKYVLGNPVTTTQQIPPTPDHIDKLTSLTLPAAAPGIYLLEIKPTGGTPTYQIINISNLVLIRSNCPQGIMWIAADATTGHPVKGAKLQGWILKGEKNILSQSAKKEENIIIPFTGETNAQGILLVPIPKEDRDRNINAACLAFHEQSFAPWNWIGEGQHFGLQKLFVPQEKHHTEFTFLTSQPVYQPGQTVLAQCRIISPNYEKANIEKLGNKEWNIAVSDPMEKPLDIGKQTVKTDAMGAFPFEYTLAPHAKPGDYRISLWEKGTNRMNAYTAVFRVEEYQKQRLNISITPKSNTISLGDEMQFTIQAYSSTGSPVAEGKAIVNVSQAPFLSAWKPSWKWNWLATLAYQPPCGPAISTKILSDHQVTLDNQGRAIITLPTKQDQNDFGKMAQEYKINVSMTDSSLGESVASVSILATVRPFEAFAQINSNYAKPGEPIPVSFFAKTIQGNPVPGVTGTATLSRLTIEQGNIVETKLSSTPVSLDHEGIGSLITTADTPGSYKLTLALKDDKGQEASISKEFLAYETSSSKNESAFPSPNLKLTPDKKSYTPGETARVLVTSSNKNAFVWAFTRSGWDNEQLHTLTLQNQFGTLDVETSQKDMPNFGISAFTLSNGILFDDKTSILLPPKNKFLNVHVTSNKKIYHPGEEGTITVQIKTKEGKPAPANTQVTLAIYNKELNRFARNTRPFSQKVWSFTNPEPKSTATTGNNECRGIEVLLDYMDLSSLSDLSVFIPSVYLWQRLDNNKWSGAPSYPETLWRIVSANIRLHGSKQLPDSIKRRQSDYYPDQQTSSRKPFLTIPANETDCIKWCGTLVTDEKGQIQIPFKTSGDLTTWQVKAWAISSDLSVGEAITDFNCLKEP